MKCDEEESNKRDGLQRDNPRVEDYQHGLL